jgi:UDP-glucose 4-epimerase
MHKSVERVVSRRRKCCLFSCTSAYRCEDLTLNHFLSHIDKTKINKIIYISTSGVYGDKKDQLVTEESELIH